MKKPLILITNDDGINAKGLYSLVEVSKEFGEIVVVAPNKPQSGMGHAITINNPLRLYKSTVFDGIEAYSSSGTPVDCVKLGLFEVLKRKPDFIFSGINHGENTSTNVLYSGTMAAAIEGSMEGITSIGFSLADFNPEADFNPSKAIIKDLLTKLLVKKIPSNICLNVNIPKTSLNKIKGFKVCNQARAFWDDRFEKRMDQFGKPYYWLTGDFSSSDVEPSMDLFAIKNNYVSIVPTQYDMTSYQSMELIKKWGL